MSGAIRCPQCSTYHTKVKDSRPNIVRNSIRRKRECANCGHRWFTLELEENLVKRMEVSADPRLEAQDN